MSTPSRSLPADAFTVITSDARATTETDWVTSRHSFSFGDHYDPGNTHFGTLLVNNEERVSPGQGFDTHPHRETEIVTWVTEGALVHQDSEGHSGVIHPGLAQRMSAGTGILHSERNDTAEGQVAPVRFVAMWIAPDESGLAPSYDQRDVGAELGRGGLVTVASGDPAHDSAIRIANRSATLSAARLAAALGFMEKAKKEGKVAEAAPVSVDALEDAGYTRTDAERLNTAYQVYNAAKVQAQA